MNSDRAQFNKCLILGLKGALREANFEIRRLKNSLRSYYYKCSHLESTNLDLETRLDDDRFALEQANSDLKDKLTKLRIDLKKKENETVNLNFKVSELRALVDEKMNEIETLKNDNNSLLRPLKNESHNKKRIYKRRGKSTSKISPKETDSILLQNTQVSDRSIFLSPALSTSSCESPQPFHTNGGLEISDIQSTVVDSPPSSTQSTICDDFKGISDQSSDFVFLNSLNCQNKVGISNDENFWSDNVSNINAHINIHVKSDVPRNKEEASGSQIKNNFMFGCKCICTCKFEEKCELTKSDQIHVDVLVDSDDFRLNFEKSNFSSIQSAENGVTINEVNELEELRRSESAFVPNTSSNSIFDPIDNEEKSSPQIPKGSVQNSCKNLPDLHKDEKKIETVGKVVSIDQPLKKLTLIEQCTINSSSQTEGENSCLGSNDVSVKKPVVKFPLEYSECFKEETLDNLIFEILGEMTSGYTDSLESFHRFVDEDRLSTEQFVRLIHDQQISNNKAEYCYSKLEKLKLKTSNLMIEANPAKHVILNTTYVPKNSDKGNSRESSMSKITSLVKNISKAEMKLSSKDLHQKLERSMEESGSAMTSFKTTEIDDNEEILCKNDCQMLRNNSEIDVYEVLDTFKTSSDVLSAKSRALVEFAVKLKNEPQELIEENKENNTDENNEKEGIENCPTEKAKNVQQRSMIDLHHLRILEATVNIGGSPESNEDTEINVEREHDIKEKLGNAENYKICELNVKNRTFDMESCAVISARLGRDENNEKERSQNWPIENANSVQQHVTNDINHLLVLEDMVNGSTENKEDTEILVEYKHDIKEELLNPENDKQFCEKNNQYHALSMEFFAKVGEEDGRFEYNEKEKMLNYHTENGNCVQQRSTNDIDHLLVLKNAVNESLEDKDDTEIHVEYKHDIKEELLNPENYKLCETNNQHHTLDFKSSAKLDVNSFSSSKEQPRNISNLLFENCVNANKLIRIDSGLVIIDGVNSSPEFFEGKTDTRNEKELDVDNKETRSDDDDIDEGALVIVEDSEENNEDIDKIGSIAECNPCESSNVKDSMTDLPKFDNKPFLIAERNISEISDNPTVNRGRYNLRRNIKKINFGDWVTSTSSKRKRKISNPCSELSLVQLDADVQFVPPSNNLEQQLENSIENVISEEVALLETKKPCLPNFYIEKFFESDDDRIKRMKFFTPFDEVWCCIKNLDIPAANSTNDSELIACEKNVLRQAFNHRKAIAKPLLPNERSYLFDGVKHAAEVYRREKKKTLNIALANFAASASLSNRITVCRALETVLMTSVKSTSHTSAVERDVFHDIVALCFELERRVFQGFIDFMKEHLRANMFARLFKISSSHNGHNMIATTILQSRLYTLLNKLNGKIEDTLNLMYDSLMQLKNRAHPIAYGVLTEWPEILSLHSCKSHLWTEIMLFCYVHHRMIYNAELYRVAEVQTLIGRVYHIKLGEKTAEEHAREIMMKVDDVCWVEAVTLLCKRQMFAWSYANIVTKYFIPLFRICKADYVNPALLIKVIRALDIIIQSGPADLEQSSGYNIEAIVLLLSEIMSYRRGVRELEEMICITLCQLSTWKFSLCSKLLLSWVPPDGLISSHTINILNAKMRKKGIYTDWLAFLNPSQYEKNLKRKRYSISRSKNHTANSQNVIPVGLSNATRNRCMQENMMSTKEKNCDLARGKCTKETTTWKQKKVKKKKWAHKRRAMKEKATMK